MKKQYHYSFSCRNAQYGLPLLHFSFEESASIAFDWSQQSHSLPYAARRAVALQPNYKQKDIGGRNVAFRLLHIQFSVKGNTPMTTFLF